MRFSTEAEVRFSETDAKGHVNNVSYFIYIELGRVGFLKKMLENEKEINFVVASLTCDYKQSAYFEQTLKIETELARIGTKSIELRHTITEIATNQLIAIGKSIEVYIDAETQKAKEIPDDLRARLENFIAAVHE